MLSISPTQSNVQAALQAFLSAVLPGPLSGGSPAAFVGTITGTVLTVNKVLLGQLVINSPVLGAAPGTFIQSLGSGTGGTGTYNLSVSQNLNNGNPVTMATGWTIIAGQQNRTPIPANPWFAVFTPMRVDRLATNVDAAADCKLTGSLAGGVLTVSAVALGTVAALSTVTGTNVAAGTIITRQLGGTPGGAGTYAVTGTQNLASQTMSAGSKTMTQSAEVTVQVDFHSPAADTTAGDAAQTVSTALRDEFGTTFFASLAPPLNGVAPLYADDPHQVPFMNDQNQYEWRWSLDTCLQVQQTVTVPLESADAATVTINELP